MTRKLTRIASEAVTVGGILSAVAMNAQLAEAGPAVTQVPCGASALAKPAGLVTGCAG
jgi:hypothetical protein